MTGLTDMQLIWLVIICLLFPYLPIFLDEDPQPVLP